MLCIGHPVFNDMADENQKAIFQKTLQAMIVAQGLVSVVNLKKKLQAIDFPMGTVNGYHNMKRSDFKNNPVFGEFAEECSEIRKTFWKAEGVKGKAQAGFCLESFDDDITTDEEYYARTYSFTQEGWNQPMKEKPGQFTDKKPKTAERVEESGEESSGGSTDNEREKRYAEVLYRRKNIVLEGPPGTGKTYAIEGIVKELRSRGNEVDGDGEGEDAITMHPATSYEDFIEGLRPIGEGNFGYKPGVFVQRVKHAIQNPHQQHVLLLDELNRSNVPRVLGDLLTTLEPSKRTESLFNLARKGDYFTDFNFVSATKVKPEAGKPSTLRFSIPQMREANSGREEVEYICNPSDGDIRSKTIDIGTTRDLGVGEFAGTHGVLHSVLGGEFLNEVVFISINGIAHPIVSSGVVEMILNSNPIPPDTEIQILTEDGVQSYFTDSQEYIEKEETKRRFYGIISLNIAVEPDIDCECYDDDGEENEDMVSDYYWCKACDVRWDHRGRTEVSDRTEVSLSGSKKLLHVPNNLLIVATMNTTDRSVAPLDAALRRRFVFLRVDHLDKLPRKAKKGLSGERLKVFNDTEKLWMELNKKLKTTLGHDATIGHSYLFDLIKELERAESDEICDELRKQFWQYSVLPQVADLLDATGRSNVVWEKMGLKDDFKAIELSLNTGPKDFKSFARTIVEEKKDEE